MRKIVLFLLIPILSSGQNSIGIPEVINYSKQKYLAGLQNWKTKQDKNGIIYVANNEGLLSFDGKNWTINPLPNKTIVRSVEIAKDNNIYVGGQDEMGYFAPNSNGKLSYHSLLDLIKGPQKSFGDIWDIISDKNSIYFRSSKQIFKLNKGIISSYQAPSEWLFLANCNGLLYAQDNDNGLVYLKNNKWIAVETGALAIKPITSMLSLENGDALVTTYKSGLFTLTNNTLVKLENKNDALFKNERIYCAAKINNDRIALGSNNSGVYIIDNQGNIIQAFSRTEGLQNNNVLSLFLDNQGNLWSGLDNGISLITYSNAIKQIHPKSLEESVYSSAIFQNRLYMATSNGLYYTSLQNMKDLSYSKGDFKFIEGSKGQNWNLSALNNSLYLGHHEGAFLVEGNSIKKIASSFGHWNFTPFVDKEGNQKILSGFYNGISILGYDNSTSLKNTEINFFKESSRFIEVDNSANIWISHPYHGVYKIDKNNRIVNFGEKNGLPSNLDNHVYKIHGNIVIATKSGVYDYDPKKSTFFPSNYFKNNVGNISIRYLKEDSIGNIWFIHDKLLGVIETTDNIDRVIYMPELTNSLVSGFEFVYNVDEHNVFIGGEKGLFHINFENYKKNISPLELKISSVKIISTYDSLLFGGYFKPINDQQIQDSNFIPKITNDWETIRIDYACTLFGNQNNLEYSYKLKGFGNNWSEWTNRSEKEYTNLPAGNYNFQVRVRNNLGNESSAISYSFIILPPWYFSIWMYFIYFIIIGITVFLLSKYQRNKFKRQKVQFEKEQIRLQNVYELEISKTEIDYKNTELATSAMHLLQKAELLSKIKQELSALMKNVPSKDGIEEIKKMIKILNEDDKKEEEWNHFSQHFDKVHSDFISKVKELHPKISGNDLKLCAMIRMNLSSKEIAQLMNISLKGVELSRYRLRKKLALETSTNLFDYLIKIK